MSKPVTVKDDANCDEMNVLHGEAYGVDWVYPPRNGIPRTAEKIAEGDQVAVVWKMGQESLPPEEYEALDNSLRLLCMTRRLACPQ